MLGEIGNEGDDIITELIWNILITEQLIRVSEENFVLELIFGDMTKSIVIIKISF